VTPSHKEAGPRYRTACEVMARLDRRTTILAVDVAGYSRLMSHVEEGTLEPETRLRNSWQERLSPA
jgi:class 3 adenylate cyclase